MNYGTHFLESGYVQHCAGGRGFCLFYWFFIGVSLTFCQDCRPVTRRALAGLVNFGLVFGNHDVTSEMQRIPNRLGPKLLMWKSAKILNMAKFWNFSGKDLFFWPDNYFSTPMLFEIFALLCAIHDYTTLLCAIHTFYSLRLDPHITFHNY
jgi:hypothetical protein